MVDLVSLKQKKCTTNNVISVRKRNVQHIVYVTIKNAAALKDARIYYSI